MSKRVNSDEIGNEVAAKQRADNEGSGSDDDLPLTQQLTVYNNGGEDDDDEVHHPDGNKMLCIFKTPTMTRDVTWMDKLRYNLKEKNMTVFQYNSKLFENLGFLRESINIDDNISEFLPTVSQNIVITRPKSPRVVYQVGKLCKGGMIPFFFFDYVRVTAAESTFGNYLSMNWSNMYLHNEAFAKLIIEFKRWECDTMKLKNVVYVNMPAGITNPADAHNNVAAKAAFTRKFFDIKQKSNEQNFMTGELKKKIVCEQFTQDRFREVFKFQNADDKTSSEVQMLAGVLIEGFKQSKEDTDYETVNCKTLQEKTYSLSVKPMVFFNIEE
ncbi:Dbp-2 [Helicoverpa armigera multiple nucleopolyhedrovirus]|uniref:Dbp n=1 Tax=Mamestra brassicae nuclear polyhedrosis virus TaxID=78219 RepID=A0A077D341_NPVMB|nr:Dbp-2 [Helicoverpa armigera multiple nucleopolyhedrovirus]AIL25227.1 dbp [Mamestra brassicae multiple nucleopolyhedrovirus]